MKSGVPSGNASSTGTVPLATRTEAPAAGVPSAWRTIPASRWARSRRTTTGSGSAWVHGTENGVGAKPLARATSWRGGTVWPGRRRITWKRARPSASVRCDCPLFTAQLTVAPTTGWPRSSSTRIGIPVTSAPGSAFPSPSTRSGASTTVPGTRRIVAEPSGSRRPPIPSDSRRRRASTSRSIPSPGGRGMPVSRKRPSAPVGSAHAAGASGTTSFGTHAMVAPGASRGYTDTAATGFPPTSTTRPATPPAGPSRRVTSRVPPSASAGTSSRATARPVIHAAT